MQHSSSCVLSIDLHVVIAEIAAPRYAVPPALFQPTW